MISSLASAFGLWALIGKSLAIVPEARIDRRSGGASIVEALLAISGEDTLAVNRKFLEPVTMRLLTCLMFLTNELPNFTDAAGALASRFLIILKVTESFKGGRILI